MAVDHGSVFEEVSRTLPASKFPEEADSYVCDMCGRDVTSHLHQGRAHIQTPIGPVHYTCRCGQRYVSGMVEWDFLSDSERRRRIRDTIVLGTFTFLPLIAFAVLGYFALRNRGIALVALTGIAVVPAIVFLRLFLIVTGDLPRIGGSLWRTRIRGRVSS